MMTRTKSAMATIGLAVALGAALTAPKVVAADLAYGGRLVDGNGTPIAGPVDLTLRFFGSEKGTDLLGSSRTFPAVALADGVFQLTLALDDAEQAAIFSHLYTMLKANVLKTLAIIFSLLSPAAASAEGGCSYPPQFETRTVRGSSMAGLVHGGQDIVFDRNAYRCQAVARDDLIVIEKSQLPAPLIKQVKVLPGDEVDLVPAQGGVFHLKVNGDIAKNHARLPYEFFGGRLKMLRLYVDQFQKKIPANIFFVFGTDPRGSKDSGTFGPVTRQEIIGKVTSVK
jgi:signal peptidase I